MIHTKDLIPSTSEFLLPWNPGFGFAQTSSGMLVVADQNLVVDSKDSDTIH